jgi:hypothetical protein
MTDPFSVAAGTAGLISLGMKTTHTLIQFYSLYKHQDSNIARTTEKLESLLGTLQVLESALQHRSNDPLIHHIDSSVQHSREIIQELQQECAKLTASSSNFTWSVTKVVGRRAAYPFRASTLNKLDEDVGEMRSYLSLALDVLQLQDSRTLQDDLAKAKSVIELIRTTQISVAIRDWLRAPNVSVNHNAARTKRHPGTGMWFIQGPHISPGGLLISAHFSGSTALQDVARLSSARLPLNMPIAKGDGSPMLESHVSISPSTMSQNEMNPPCSGRFFSN